MNVREVKFVEVDSRPDTPPAHQSPPTCPMWMPQLAGSTELQRTAPIDSPGASR